MDIENVPPGRVERVLAGRSISHLNESDLPVEVRVDGTAYIVAVRIYYTNHCWTKSRENEPDEDVIFRERKSDGSIDERVFCQKRWEFSKQLPDIISNISHALCLPGRSKEIFYRLKNDAKVSSHAGWYICARLDANHSKKLITLSIRSTHYRTNQPADLRGAPTRFWAIFWKFYKALRERHDWVTKAETKKNPPAELGGSE